MTARDIDGHIRRERRQPVEQQPRLHARAAAELHEQRVIADEAGDVVPVLFENAQLGARGVILFQLADAIEQLGTERIVEIHRRDALRRTLQTLQHVRDERLVSGVMIAKLKPDLGRGPHQPTSAARRTPLNCQRAVG